MQTKNPSVYLFMQCLFFFNYYYYILYFFLTFYSFNVIKFVFYNFILTLIARHYFNCSLTIYLSLSESLILLKYFFFFLIKQFFFESIIIFHFLFIYSFYIEDTNHLVSISVFLLSKSILTILSFTCKTLSIEFELYERRYINKVCLID